MTELRPPRCAQGDSLPPNFSPLTSHFSFSLLIPTSYLSLLCLWIPGRQLHPAGALPVEADLEGVLSGAWKRDIEHQHRAGFDVHDAGGGLAELHGSLPTEKLVAGIVHEPPTQMTLGSAR